MQNVDTNDVSTSAGQFRTPDQLTGSVSQRDREWANWERDAMQCIVNQLADLLSKNYPGHGWFHISLKGQYYSDTSHEGIIWRALASAYGNKMKGLCGGVTQVFSRVQWRVWAKKGDNGYLNFYFLPAATKLRLRDRIGWFSAVANVNADLGVHQLRTPPLSVRPNGRNQKGDASGVEVTGGGGSSEIAAKFPYENLC